MINGWQAASRDWLPPIFCFLNPVFSILIFYQPAGDPAFIGNYVHQIDTTLQASF